jgi:hypothetical protein
MEVVVQDGSATGRPSPGMTIAIPCFNEQECLARTASRALATLEGAGVGGQELLLVNDGSTDDTARIAADLARRDPRVRVHTHPRNLGFAGAQRSCYRHASMDWVFLVPADGQVGPERLAGFLAWRGSHDLVLGISRPFEEPGFRGVTSAAYHALARRLLALPPGDFSTCLLVRRSLADAIDLRCSTPVGMTELVAKAVASGARVGTIEVPKAPREGGVARGGGLVPQLPRILFELARLAVEVRRGGGRPSVRGGVGGIPVR